MVMVSPRLNPQASWEFEAEILVLHHPTTISPRYQAMGRCLRALPAQEAPHSKTLTKCSSNQNAQVSARAKKQVSFLFSDALSSTHELWCLFSPANTN